MMQHSPFVDDTYCGCGGDLYIVTIQGRFKCILLYCIAFCASSVSWLCLCAATLPFNLSQTEQSQLMGSGH